MMAGPTYHVASVWRISFSALVEVLSPFRVVSGGNGGLRQVVATPWPEGFEIGNNEHGDL